MYRSALALLVLACAVACGPPRETLRLASAGNVHLEEAPPAEDVVAPEDTAPHAWLYRVSGGDSAAPSYLLGTMHLGVTFRHAVPTPLDSALFDARTVVMEVDLREAQRFFREAPPPRRARRTRLDRAMGRESWAHLVAELEHIAPVEILRTLDPGFLTLYLSQVRMAEVEAREEGRTPIPGAISSTRLDRSIFDWSVAAGVPFVALETPEEAMAAFEGLDSRGAIEGLERMVDDPEEARLEARRLRDAYLSLDESTLLAILAESPPEVHTAIFDNRNQAWMRNLVPEIQAGRAFVAVGCGHLIGSGSVVELLRAQGYVVERVLGDGGMHPSERSSIMVSSRGVPDRF